MTPVELARLFEQPAEAGRRAQAARAAQFGRRVLVRPAPPHRAPAVAALLRDGSAAVDLGDWSEGHVLKALADAKGSTGQDPKDMSDVTVSIEHGAADMSYQPGDFAAGASVDGSSGDRSASNGGTGDGDAAQGDASGTAGEAGPRAAGQGEAGRAAALGDPGWPDPAALRPGDRLVVQVDRERLGAYCDYLVRLAAAAPADLSFAPVCARPGGLLRLHLIAAARIALPAHVRVEARHDLLGIRLAQVALGFGADTLAGPITAARRLPLAGVPRPDEATPAGLAALIERAGLEAVLHDLSLETSP